MEELDKWIKRINLSFTDTCKRDDFFADGFNADEKEVNIEDSISLYDLISSFNYLYVLFKKEYDKLEKFELGKYIDILAFRKYNNYKGEKCRSLAIYIENPYITNRECTYLLLEEHNGKIQSAVSNALFPRPFDETYYCEDVDLDKNKIKQYLDLFDKHSLLFDLYNRLWNTNLLYGDGADIITAGIDCEHDGLLYSLKNIEIRITSLYSWIEEKINKISATFDLGEHFEIDNDNSYLMLDNQKVNAKSDLIIDLLKRIYINKKYLVEYRYQHDEEKIDKQIKTLRNVNRDFKPYSYVHSNDEEMIANMLDNFEYDPSKREKVLTRYDKLKKYIK